MRHGEKHCGNPMTSKVQKCVGLPSAAFPSAALNSFACSNETLAALSKSGPLGGLDYTGLFSRTKCATGSREKIDFGQVMQRLNH
jgi:hypothetical protein